MEKVQHFILLFQRTDSVTFIIRLKSYEEDLLIYLTLSPKEGEEIEPYKIIREEFSKFMQVVDVCFVVGFSTPQYNIIL